MDQTLSDVNAQQKAQLPTMVSAEDQAAKEFLALARDRGLSLTGPSGLLQQFTKSVLEAALDEEMTEHLGHERHRAPEDRESTNVRNGTRPKTVLTAGTGPVEIEVPRDREGTFEPVIVKKRQRRLSDVDEVVLSLSARGLTTGEISAHFAQIYGASVSKETTDHRPGAQGDGGVAEPAPGGRLRRHLHRRDHGQDPRRPGGESTDLCRDRRHLGRGEGRARLVGRHRW
jgi:Transposase, Mutator family